MIETAPDFPQAESGKPTDASRPASLPSERQAPLVPTEPWIRRVWLVLARYPIPLVAVGLLLLAGVFWLARWGPLAQLALLAIIVVGGVPLLWETFNQLVHREFSVDLIAILAIAGSVALRQYLAGAIVVLMLSGGEALEAYALRRARRSLSSLAERAPRIAHIWRGTRLMDVAASEVEVGTIVMVKSGELIPVDGVVVSGSASVSEADLTGEPLPVRKEAGAIVLSGSVNLDDILEVRATKVSADSQYAQIVRLVEEAQRHKAPIHRVADRYGGWFTLVAVGMAAAAWILSGDSLFALAVLVVATPCPLILATPIAIMSGIDVAARMGIIVKSGATIEEFGMLDTAIFDKTGTLTLGTPQFIGVRPLADKAVSDGATYDDETLHRLVASAEQFSAHILARAVVAAAQERKLVLLPATGFQESLGKGIRAQVTLLSAGPDSATATDVAVGNRTFMRALDIALPETALAERTRRSGEGQIVSFVALDKQVVGLLLFADTPRPDLADLVPALKAQGISQTVLLTGDGATVAAKIGKVAGVDRVVAQCLPGRKVEVVSELRQQGHHVLMVGDGINDAPALTAANVGLAMGAHGLSATSTVADAVLLSNDILRVVSAVALGRRVMRVAQQGIWIGMGLSLVAMIVAAFGFIPPAQGAILQEGIDVLVILNALRAGRAGRAPQS